MNRTQGQIKREKRDYIRQTKKSFSILMLILYYLWIVRLKVVMTDPFRLNPYCYTLKVQVINPWNPLGWIWALILLVVFIASNNVNLTRQSWDGWADVFKFE